MTRTSASIMKKQNELQNVIIENNIITKVDVNTIAHFSNITSFEIYCQNIVPYSGINNISNMGNVIRAFIEIMELENEDGIRLSEIKNIPCRLLFVKTDSDNTDNTWGKSAIGIGHFMDDRFVLFSDLATVG